MSDHSLSTDNTRYTKSLASSLATSYLRLIIDNQREWPGNAGKIANVADATSVIRSPLLNVCLIFDFRNIVIACRLKKFYQNIQW